MSLAAVWRTDRPKVKMNEGTKGISWTADIRPRGQSGLPR